MTQTTKMTMREFLTFVKENVADEEVKAYAEAEIKKLDEMNAKRREKTSKKREENKPLLDRIYNEILTGEPKTAADVADVIEVSVQKASSLLRTLVSEGMAEDTEIKVPKKGKCKGYTRVEVTEDTADTVDIEE